MNANHWVEDLAERVFLALSCLDITEEQRIGRRSIVLEALDWIGTPYHHAGRVKGSGVDCGMLLIEVYERVGLVPHIDPGYYPADFMLHHEDESYLDQVMAHLVPIPSGSYPLPGDIITFKFGRCQSHGAIVVEWPWIIHSYFGQGVILEELTENSPLWKRKGDTWTFWR